MDDIDIEVESDYNVGSDTHLNLSRTTSLSSSITRDSGSVPHEHDPFKFMDLPSEIRNLCYKFILSIPPGEIFHLSQPLHAWSYRGINSSLMLVSREVHSEAFLVFLQSNTFLIGTNIRCPSIFLNLGLEASSSLRYLSIHMNSRPDPAAFLDLVDTHCIALHELDLRTSPRNPFLLVLADLLNHRSHLPSRQRGPTIMLDISILAKQLPQNDEFKSSLSRAFHANPKTTAQHGEPRFTNILSSCRTIRIRGTLDRSDLLTFEAMQSEDGWAFEKTRDITIVGCEHRDQVVTRTWRKMELDEE